jgi:hypothetical protein
MERGSTMDLWYVWECNKCSSTLTINYDANEEDYERFKNCGCEDNGIYEWKYNHKDNENT